MINIEYDKLFDADKNLVMRMAVSIEELQQFGMFGLVPDVLWFPNMPITR